MIKLQLCEFYLVTNREVWQLEDSFVGIFYVLKLSNKIVIYSLYLGCPMHQSEKKNLLKCVENWANDVYVRLFIAVQFWALRYINNRCCHFQTFIFLLFFLGKSHFEMCNRGQTWTNFFCTEFILHSPFWAGSPLSKNSIRSN